MKEQGASKGIGHETIVIDLQHDFDLVCHVLGPGGWQEKKFAARKQRVLIGNQSHEAQIVIPEDAADAVQAVAQKVGDRWLVMETGRKDLMTVNGFPCRQAVVDHQGKAAIAIGQTTMVFTAGVVEEQRTNLIPEGERVLLQVAGQSLPYQQGQPFLIGTHPACEIRLDRIFANQKGDPDLKDVMAEPFVAVLCSCRGRLFVTPLGRAEVSLAGEPLLDTTPLPRNADLKVSSLALPVVLPDELAAGDGDDIPDLRGNRFALMQLSESGQVLGTIELWPAGKSMIVGRSEQEANLVIAVDEVSRKHAQMILYEKNILLEDCYSSNGTFVNDEQVGRTRVRAGDIVRFGQTQQFLLCYTSGE